MNNNMSSTPNCDIETNKRLHSVLSPEVSDSDSPNNNKEMKETT